MLINTLLVRWNGGWTEVTDPVSTGIYGDIEGTLGLGAVQSIDAVTEIASSQLNIYANPREEYTLGIEPIGAPDTPYVSYQVGDTVTVDEPNAFPTDERVVAMTVTDDPATGRALFSPTIKDVLLSAQERTSQGFKKMSNGTLRGSSVVATPVNNVPVQKSSSGIRGRTTPFLVVAADGTGDYTSIKDAIDSLPVFSASALAPFTVIFVKDGIYNDGSAVIDVDGKQFMVTGKLSPATQGEISNGTWAGPEWTFGGFSSATSFNTVIDLAGLQINRSGSAVLIAGASGHPTVTISDCQGTWNGILAPATTATSFRMRRCDWVGRLVNGNGTRAGADDISVKDCYTAEFLDGTVTWIAGTHFLYHDNMIGPDAGGSGDIHTHLGNFSMMGNEWTSSSGNRIGITWQPTTSEKLFRLVGNVSGAGGISVESDILVDYTSVSPAATVLIAGNVMREMNLTVNGPTTTSRQDTYISGAYHTLTLEASHTKVDVSLNLATDTGLTALTVTGNQNLICAALNGGTGAVSTPYNVAGNTNFFLFSGEASFTAAGINTGAGNLRAATAVL